MRNIQLFQSSILHPLLFAFFPILFVFSYNMSFLSFDELFFPSLLFLVDLIYALRISPRKVALQKETRKVVSANPRIYLEAILLLLGGGRADLRKALKPWHLKISQILSGRKQVMQWLDLGNSRPIPSRHQIMWHLQLT